MKTYCKPAEVNIENLDFIKEQVQAVKEKIPKFISVYRENHAG